jgi:cbb3-type cytochrome oxidase maturation protein
MEVVFVLVPISLVIIGVALWAFVWSVRNDQFEDLDKEAYAILFDEDEADRNNNTEASE